MNYRKKLIEVALPLEDINTQSAREKSIRHGHPSTLHLWWARRPLAACRAVLFASLVDDPDSDPQFLKHDGSVDTERSSARRSELFDLIKELVKWENSNNPTIINAARAQIAASIASRKIYDTKEWTKDQIVCREKAWTFVCRNAKPENVNAFLVAHAPPVLDPFCGGGSIPLEAQRLGLRAFGSDLNPVPVLITKALIEIPPKFANMPPVNPESNARLKDGWKGAHGLAEDVRYYGQWMRDQAEKRIGHLYPKIKITEEMATDRPDLKPYLGQELTVIAWLWARTVASPNPAVGGARVPLVRSFWLSTKIGKEAWVEPIIDQKENTYHFAVRVGKPPEGFDPGIGTIGRKGGRCILSGSNGSPMPLTHVRAEGKAGRMGQRLMAIVAEGTRGRVYLSPIASHAEVAESATPTWRPDCQLPAKHRNFQTPAYGMPNVGDLFTPRQLTALTTFSDLVREAREKVLADAQAAPQFLIAQPAAVPPGPPDASPVTPTAESYADAVATYSAFAVDKCSNYWSSICGWHSGREIIMSTYGRQALPMVWDYAEANPLSESSGNFLGGVDQAGRSLSMAPAGAPGNVRQLSATADRRADAATIISTDPPYYDNIGYSDLSDFFYVWLRRSLGDIYPELFKTLLTPKTEELIATPYRHGGDKQKAQKFFETGLGEAFHRMREMQPPEYPMTVFYAFKQSETEEDGGDEENGQNEQTTASTGWETMLAGLRDAGFSITGTWPMRTELVGNLKKNMSALASSIVLSCRPRSANAPVATRREFLSALKRELPDSLRFLQQGNIAPVDLAQASIGPGMAIYTRYAKVLEADGSPMAVRSALAAINQTLDEVLAEQEGEFDPDTRWAVAWFEQFGMEDGPFGQAETLSRAKNTAVNGLVEAGIISARAGKVRLLKRSELLPNWNPATDKRRVHWEIAQYLIRAHDTAGESAAADLLRQLGAAGEIARDLAYRLYNICERKKWAAEALAYNSLVIAWPEIAQLARQAKPIQAEAKELF